MRKLVFCVIVGTIAFLSNNTLADTTVFPPENCKNNEVRVMGWQEGAEHTYCLSGKELLQAAFNSMGCAKEQTIGYVKGEPVCQASSGNFGGTYITSTRATNHYPYTEGYCASSNPKTKNCSCPDGTTAYETARTFECITTGHSGWATDGPVGGASTKCTPYYAYECN